MKNFIQAGDCITLPAPELSSLPALLEEAADSGLLAVPRAASLTSSVTVANSGPASRYELARAVFAGIGADHMRVYIIDTVLDPNTAPASVTPTTTSGSAIAVTMSAPPPASSIAGTPHFSPFLVRIRSSRTLLGM